MHLCVSQSLHRRLPQLVTDGPLVKTGLVIGPGVGAVLVLKRGLPAITAAGLAIIVIRRSVE